MSLASLVEFNVFATMKLKSVHKIQKREKNKKREKIKNLKKHVFL